MVSAMGGSSEIMMTVMLAGGGSQVGTSKAAPTGGPTKRKPTTPPPSLGLRKKAAGGAAWLGQKSGISGAASAAKGAVDKRIDPKTQAMAKQSLKHTGATAKGAGKAMGISVGISSILKQSQLFTGVIGTIFQILGMLVDVIIMPFMPILIPVIKLFASMIPPLMAGAMWIQKYIQIGVDWLGSLPGIIWGQIKRLWDFISNPGEWWSGPLHPVKGYFEDVIGFITDIPDKIWGFLQDVIGFIMGIPETIWGFLQDIWGIIKAVLNLYLTAIITVKDFAVGIFQKISNFFIGVWDTAQSWFSTAVTTIKDFFTGIWSGGQNWVLDRISSIKDFFTGLWDTAEKIIDIIKNKVINIFNKIDTIRLKILDIISTINPFNWIPKIIEKIRDIIPSPGDLVDSVPGVGAVKDVASKLKFWQHGAIVRQPTLGIAGESGPEAIIPLRNLTRQSVAPAPVNITVINRTPEGRESQEVFMITRHQEQEQEYEYEVQQRTSLLGVT